MDLKRKLFLAREIALNYDYVTKGEESLIDFFNYVNDDMGIESRIEDLEEVLEEFDGNSLSSIEYDIIMEYFK